MARLLLAGTCAVLSGPVGAASEHQREAAQSMANPIRKVVTMLQSMQKQVTEEGKREEDLYQKFMCYCQTNGGGLSSSIENAKGKIEAVSSDLKSTGERKSQTEADLQEHQQSRADAKDTMAKAAALRSKEASAYAKESSDLTTNVAAIAKAVAALEQGAAGAFLQTNDALLVRSFAMERSDLPDATREELLSFLSGTAAEGYAPRSGEITGILKQMGDEMSKSLQEATDAENTAIANFEALMAAKKKELGSLQSQIESEMERVGRLGVQAAEMANDIEDTQAALTADEEFKLELESSCKTKTSQWEEIKRTRAEEQLALAETIKVLNDDDALELFKKTLPTPRASLLQVQESSESQRARALALLTTAAKAGKRPQLDLIALVLRGKKAGFEKVVAMIDGMVENLGREQATDDSKKAYCNTQLDEADDSRKAHAQSVADSEKAIDEMEGLLETVASEIKELTAGIKSLDKAVADATDQRKSQNEEFQALIAADSTAKEVLGWAKNRLNKFYSPAQYKPPPKRELTEEERITVNFGGTVTTAAPGGIAGTGIGAALVQVHSHSGLMRGAPPPPPETFGPYTKKGGESNGVLAMIDLLVKDLDKEMQEAEVSEKDAQADYQTMMEGASSKRAADAKSLTDREGAKADAEEALEAETGKKGDSAKELMNTERFIQGLHSECDWLLRYADARKEARASEVESLKNARAVLSGADYSLVQTSRHSGFLAPRSQ